MKTNNDFKNTSQHLVFNKLSKTTLFPGLVFVGVGGYSMAAI